MYAQRDLQTCTARAEHKSPQGDQPMTRKDFNLIAETIRLLPSFDLPLLDNWGSHADAVRFDTVVNRFAVCDQPSRYNFFRFIKCVVKDRFEQEASSISHIRELRFQSIAQGHQFIYFADDPLLFC
jgi:hypothetical protein